MTANNQPGDLRMFIRSEPYDVETPNANRLFGNGTGKRTVTLEGWVNVEAKPHCGDCEAWIIWACRALKIATPSLKGVQDTITRMHELSTLPAELYKSDDNPDGLEEIDHDGSN